MSKKTIELNSATELNNSDTFVIDQGDETKKVTKEIAFSDINEKVDKALGVNEYDNTATYNVGDYCIYENILYKCTTSIVTAENFNSNHWTETEILSVLTTLSDGLTLRKNAITAYLASDFTVTQGNSYLPVNLTEKSRNGNNLSIYNGGVKIGIGISKVKINFSAIIESSVSRRSHFRIMKNNEGNTVSWIYKNVTASNAEFFSVSPILISVSENDVLNLYYYLEANDVIKGGIFTPTFFTVEVVE